MTTWPPRFSDALTAMRHLIQQRNTDGLQSRIHPVLVLSQDEVNQARQQAGNLAMEMKKMRVQILYDKGNIRSHKKLIPVIEKFPDNPVLVVDDDILQAPGWLRTFVEDHDRHPNDIIYGQGNSRVFVKDFHIIEEWGAVSFYSPGDVTIGVKPASGAAGTLYPPHTFTDPRFFDRNLLMKLSPTSDETWQYAFAMMAGKRFRMLSDSFFPSMFGSNQQVALCNYNKDRYTEIHNRIWSAIPEYLHSLI